MAASTLHIIKFGTKATKLEENMKYDVIVLDRIDFTKVKNIIIKIKTYYSNNWVKIINFSSKKIPEFFKNGNTNLIGIYPNFTSNNNFDFKINNINMYSAEYIMNCEMHIIMKKKISQNTFCKYIKFYSISYNNKTSHNNITNNNISLK